MFDSELIAITPRRSKKPHVFLIRALSIGLALVAVVASAQESHREDASRRSMADTDPGLGQGGMAANQSSHGVPTHTLTINMSGSGSGTVTSTPSGISCPGDCTEEYVDGQVVDLTPTPNGGSALAGLYGDADCSDGQVTMNSDVSCWAQFATLGDGNRDVLIALYNSTNGDGLGPNTNWKSPPLHTDGFAMPDTECTWYGVTCEIGGTEVHDLEYRGELTGTPLLLGQDDRSGFVRRSRRGQSDDSRPRRIRIRRHASLVFRGAVMT